MGNVNPTASTLQLILMDESSYLLRILLVMTQMVMSLRANPGCPFSYSEFACFLFGVHFVSSETHPVIDGAHLLTSIKHRKSPGFNLQQLSSSLKKELGWYSLYRNDGTPAVGSNMAEIYLVVAYMKIVIHSPNVNVGFAFEMSCGYDLLGLFSSSCTM